MSKRIESAPVILPDARVTNNSVVYENTSSASMIRYSRRALLSAGSLLTLAACSGTGSGLDPFAPPAGLNDPPPPASGGQTQPQANNAIGNGPVRVGLLLPFSSANGAALAQSMRNAAELAWQETSATQITVIIKDDRGTPEGASAAASEAIQEGCEILLGPVFAPTVSAAGQVVRGRNIPLIAFSTDTSVAGRSQYLLSFLPQSDVQRILSYMASQGKKSFAAIIPQNAYGNVVEGEFSQVVSSRGLRLVTTERYQPDNKQSMEQAVSRLKSSIGAADCLFIGEAPNNLGALSNMLSTAGISSSKVQFIGTSIWQSAGISAMPAMRGAMFAGPDLTGFAKYSQRYKARFNADPVRVSTLAYDAVALVGALARTQGEARFSDATLTNSSGFTGQDGLFRFTQNGTNERPMAVYQVVQGGTQIISAPARSF